LYTLFLPVFYWLLYRIAIIINSYHCLYTAARFFTNRCLLLRFLLRRPTVSVKLKCGCCLVLALFFSASLTCQILGGRTLVLFLRMALSLPCRSCSSDCSCCASLFATCCAYIFPRWPLLLPPHLSGVVVPSSTVFFFPRRFFYALPACLLFRSPVWRFVLFLHTVGAVLLKAAGHSRWWAPPARSVARNRGKTLWFVAATAM